MPHASSHCLAPTPFYPAHLCLLFYCAPTPSPPPPHPLPIDSYPAPVIRGGQGQPVLAASPIYSPLDLVLYARGAQAFCLWFHTLPAPRLRPHIILICVVCPTFYAIACPSFWRLLRNPMYYFICRCVLMPVPSYHHHVATLLLPLPLFWIDWTAIYAAPACMPACCITCGGCLCSQFITPCLIFMPSQQLACLCRHAAFVTPLLLCQPSANAGFAALDCITPSLCPCLPCTFMPCPLWWPLPPAWLCWVCWLPCAPAAV